uniref:Uncharacterized protein n=1 Tax=Panagrolaimus sp. ES5 TaxID=591445 RepID=A0AC34FSI3_9BILA
MCSNPSTTRKLTIRPDFDMDVYLHPPSMMRQHHLRSRKISTSSIDSNGDDKNGSPTLRRFSLSNIFAYFRQNSSPEFPTLNNFNGTNQCPKGKNNSAKEGIVKEEDIQTMIPNHSFHDDDEF